MTQFSLPWGGISVGDATSAPYDDDQWSDAWNLLNTYDRTVQGVIRTNHASYSSQLATTNPAGTTIRVANGAAIVDGKVYTNDANVDFSVTAPGAGSNYYRIVLRKDWAAQTVRLAQLGPDAGSPPAVTQTDATTWEISIATVQITSASAITITDTRQYVGIPRTRSFLVRPHSSDHTQAESLNGVVTDAGALKTFVGYFYCPNDFVSGMTAKALIGHVKVLTGDIDYTNTCEHNALGEDLGNHTVADSGAFTVNAAVESEVISTLSLTSMAKGDWVALTLTRDGSDIGDTYAGTTYFQGWLIEYTADW